MNSRHFRIVCLGLGLLTPGLALAELDFFEDWTATGTVGEGWGDAVATVGDVDGDGYDDILAGAPDWGGMTPAVWWPPADITPYSSSPARCLVSGS